MPSLDITYSFSLPSFWGGGGVRWLGSFCTEVILSFFIYFRRKLWKLGLATVMPEINEKPCFVKLVYRDADITHRGYGLLWWEKLLDVKTGYVHPIPEDCWDQRLFWMYAWICTVCTTLCKGLGKISHRERNWLQWRALAVVFWPREFLQSGTATIEFPTILGSCSNFTVVVDRYGDVAILWQLLLHYVAHSIRRENVNG